MAGARSALTLGYLTCALLVATACSGSGGNTHDSAPPSGDSPTPTKTSSTSSPTSSPTPSWTPPNYGTAKPAVDVYLKFQALHSRALRDPAHIPASTFDRYLGGGLKQQVDAAFAAERKQGKAYRGKTIRRVRVVKNAVADETLPWVILRDCAIVDPRDPLIEYYVATGKPVPQKPHNPPGPYADRIKIFLINGHWTITSFTVDSTRTCKP